MAEQKTTQEIIDPPKDYLQPLQEAEDGITEGVAIINTAELNQQILTAHRFPRSITAFRRKVYEMVTIDTETAESCIYAIPRDGKMIDGPSIRFAELLLVGWGNYRAATEVTDIGDRFITAQGVFFDLETNGAIQAKTMRRIVGKASPAFPNGKRFGDDMIATTGNAAASIALRNAITRGIPKALWKGLFDEAKKVAGGSAQTFGARRDKVIKELGIQGATPDQIFALLGIKGIDDLQTEHVVHLRGLQNAIKDGEIGVDEAFGPQLKPGQVVPPQPSRSDFERNTDAKTGQKKATGKKTEPQPQAKAETAKAEPDTATPAKEAEPASDPENAKSAQSDAPAPVDEETPEQKAAWLEEMKASLVNQTRANDMAELRDVVAAELSGQALKEWIGLCDTKLRAILEASRVQKPRGGK